MQQAVRSRSQGRGIDGVITYIVEEELIVTSHFDETLGPNVV
jgi:hypothetical protein